MELVLLLVTSAVLIWFYADFKNSRRERRTRLEKLQHAVLEARAGYERAPDTRTRDTQLQRMIEHLEELQSLKPRDAALQRQLDEARELAGAPPRGEANERGAPA